MLNFKRKSGIQELVVGTNVYIFQQKVEPVDIKSTDEMKPTP
jgi:hypothetical protein